MRFLQVCSHYVPAYHYGGALHVAHSLSRALAAQGHEVHVCTTSLRNPRQDLDVPLDAPVEVEGVQVYYEPVQISRYWGFSPALARRVWEQAQWAEVVLIHFHYQFASLTGGWASRLLKRPYIVFSHGSLNRFGVGMRSTVRKQIYLKWLEKGNFRNALFTAYHSQEEMETSFRFGQCRVVPNGIDPCSFTDLPPRGVFRQRYPELRDCVLYLYLGRLDAGKGLDLLLPAFRRLVERFPAVRLVLAGGDERGYVAHVRRMISDLGLAEHVVLTGLISGTDKLSVLQDADIYVLPSRSEGLSIAMLEAMYMGLPVVVTDRVGLWRQVQEHRCGLVVPLQEEQLAEALHQMATTSERAEMGCRARRLVSSQYTWDTIARGLVAQIQELIAR